MAGCKQNELGHEACMKFYSNKTKKGEVGMSLACGTGLACSNSQNELNPFGVVKVNQNFYSILWNFPK